MIDTETMLSQLLTLTFTTMYTGSISYQIFVETPARAPLDIKAKILHLNRSIDNCSIYLPLFLFPAMGFTVWSYVRTKNIQFLISFFLLIIIPVMTFIFLIKKYNQIKNAANPEKEPMNENSEYAYSDNSLEGTMKFIRNLHYVKSILGVTCTILVFTAIILSYKYEYEKFVGLQNNTTCGNTAQ